jgi:hypothetical protein
MATDESRNTKSRFARRLKIARRFSGGKACKKGSKSPQGTAEVFDQSVSVNVTLSILAPVVA